jgi:hypothetical protein
MTRSIGSYFDRADGRPYSMDFVQFGRSVGFDFAQRVERPDELGKVLGEALASGEPAIVEADITRDPVGGAEVVGWWDFPLLPSAPAEARAEYERAVAEEQHR